jgi:hypothetical protein
MKQSDFEKAMLVEFAVREVAAGSLEEMQAVLYCVRNRVRKGWHEGKWVENLEHAREYAAHECGLVRALRQEIPPLDCDNRNYQRLLNAIDDLYYGQRNVGMGTGMYGRKPDEDAQGGTLEAAVGTALYWQFLKRPVRPWFAEKIVRDPGSHPVRTQMGMLILYK